MLDIQPIAAEMHPASLLFLKSMPRVVNDASLLLAQFDDPEPMPEERIIVLNPTRQYFSRLPVVAVEHDPFTSELNTFLPQGYEFLSGLMLCQSQLPERIAAAAQGCDTVIAVFVDGLSYEDFRNFPGCQPCLVDGVTITPDGFRRLVGNPPIASRLFKRGFHTRLGFSYWHRADNTLADVIFDGIANTNRVANFDEVLERLSSSDLNGTYVQIVRSGLDHLSHAKQREKPPLEAVVQSLKQDMEHLINVLQAKPGRCRLYVASDHGLLWKYRQSLQPIDTAAGRVPARYYEWHPNGKPVMAFPSGAETLYSLVYPYLRRPLASDEAGCHGGLSYEESIIPFCGLEVNA